MTDAERESQLLEMWDRLAERLSDSDAPRADWLKREVIEPFRASTRESTDSWKLRMTALAAWSAKRESGVSVGEISLEQMRALAERCAQVQQRIHAEQNTLRILLLGLLAPSNELQMLFDDLASLLRQCETAFAALQRLRPICQAAEVDAIEREIDQAIAELPQVSAPMPDGFTELEEQVNGAGPALAARLRQWREAKLNETLETEVVQFYVDWWDDLGDEIRGRDPQRAAAIADRLNYILQHEFRLFPFAPATFQDYSDGWIQRIAGQPMVTGRVRRLVRPGLHDADDHLRVPALVEVD